MSAKANNNDPSQSNPDQDQTNKDLTDPTKLAENPELKAVDKPDPQVQADASVASAGSELSTGQIIANTIDHLIKLNPNLTPEQAGAMVLASMQKTTVEDKVAKEVAMIIPVGQPVELVYLKKDKKKKFPIEKNALTGVVVRQTRTRVVDNEEVEVPARDLNEIGIYSPADYDKFSQKGGLFEQQKINIEVWYKPGDDDQIQK